MGSADFVASALVGSDFAGSAFAGSVATGVAAGAGVASVPVFAGSAAGVSAFAGSDGCGLEHEKRKRAVQNAENRSVFVFMTSEFS